MRRCIEAMRGILIGYKAEMEHRLREQGLTLPQLRLLRTLQEHGGLSAAATARMCQITPQTLQGILTRAVRDGWIVRGTSERNGRILTATLTRHGERTLALGMAMAMEIEAVIWGEFSLSTLKSTRRVLERGLASLEKRGTASNAPKALTTEDTTVRRSRTALPMRSRKTS